MGEVVCARHCGMRVAALGIVVNHAAGMTGQPITHDETLRSECWVFDARDLGPGPLAKVSLPQRVPSGFHATWLRPDRAKPAA